MGDPLEPHLQGRDIPSFNPLEWKVSRVIGEGTAPKPALRYYTGQVNSVDTLPLVKEEPDRDSVNRATAEIIVPALQDTMSDPRQADTTQGQATATDTARAGPGLGEALVQVNQSLGHLAGLIENISGCLEAVERSQGVEYQGARRSAPEPMRTTYQFRHHSPQTPFMPNDAPSTLAPSRAETAAPTPGEIDRERYKKWDATRIGIVFPNAPRAWRESGRFYHNNIRYYRDVATFAWDVRAYTRRNPRSPLVEHIEDLMEGSAHDWYARTVPETRPLMYYSNPDGIERWLRDLETKFRLNPVEARRKLDHLTYGPKQVRQGISVDTYVASVRSALLATDPYVNDDAVVASAWNQLALEYKTQMLLPPPGTSLESFVDALDRRRIVWEDQLKAEEWAERSDARRDPPARPTVRRAQFGTHEEDQVDAAPGEDEATAYAANMSLENSLRFLAERLAKALERLQPQGAKGKATNPRVSQPLPTRDPAKDFYSNRNAQLDRQLSGRAAPKAANLAENRETPKEVSKAESPNEPDLHS
ncbi:hypothetical protein KEM52_003252 [Ascosphaera acerosa]|nr:hypothetical protein KEM52_003252 [Ascosphaera acerosa]